MRVLLIEDDRILGEAVRDHVAAASHAVDWSKTLDEARTCLAVISYQLILLDLQLPDGRGQDFLKALRRDGTDTPVIILTARDQLSDRIEGLNSGADDYLVKPFDLEELSARLQAVARRYTGKPNPIVRFGKVEIDLARRDITVDGNSTSLTGREWAVLEQFLQRPGAIVSKAQIEDALYAFGAEIESNAVEVYISRLRRKIGSDTIRTVRGVGYRGMAQ
ncbi:response regulator transcription factor [Mesorhizobium sp. B2-5-4]|uniref:response regulator n=1 Tax=unclassified Mesorhizobium TaxID=325217 RepID=UPI00112A3516|nr:MULTISPECIES: response regulator transcription factor [unclassified Mesorhizobium]TPK42177.1 response regulator transcription factor [Mesorhizobium sp. B2-5-4]TPL78499.1 response regulator transcription factor [Mesorhizobium sp. B2-3-13]TPL94505.1 response regulator transcription factor [Mesorhizobium sp. B2-3-11]